MVAEHIMRMFTLGHGSDLAYDLRRCLGRDEALSTCCGRAGSWLWQGGGRSALGICPNEGSWGPPNKIKASSLLVHLAYSVTCFDLETGLLVIFQVVLSPLLARKTEGNVPGLISLVSC